MRHQVIHTIKIGVVISVLLLSVSLAFGQTTAFNYQGRLVDSGTPATGNYDFLFLLFDTVSGGTQQGATQNLTNVAVINGSFNVQLDFGANFPGANRFLEVRVKPAGGQFYTTLTPRQQINSTPYTIKSLNATTADGLSVACVNCVTSSQIQSVNGSAVNGTIPVASVPAGSGNYIQNGASQQASSTFNISGNGTAGGLLSANAVNAVTQYNIGGSRVLSIPGSANLFAGVNAGLANTTGFQNSFFGRSAGSGNTTGNYNSFFGYLAGTGTTTGSSNAFFGNNAGSNNTTGNYNAFFGETAGSSNTTGIFNSFFGEGAGFSNTTDSYNSFFGQEAGYLSTGDSNSFFGHSAGPSNSGRLNSFFGASAGLNHTTGDRNSFFGYGAGESDRTGSNNTFIGTGADFNILDATGNNDTLLGSNTHVISGVSNATAIGANVTVTQSNTLVLGNNANVGIGTSSPLARLHIVSSSTNAADNTATFAATTIGPNQSHIHYGTTGNWFIRSADSAGKVILQDTGGNVGIGTSSPADKLHVAGDIRVGTGTTGCVKDADGTLIAGVCSSDRRFKRDITPFANLLDKVVKLQPVNFFWRNSQFPQYHFGTNQSYGLIAQEVEAVLPELISTDEQGFKAVNYSKLPLLAIQAIKEQQSQITQQQLQIKKQRSEIEQLKQLICADHPRAAVCRQRR